MTITGGRLIRAMLDDDGHNESTNVKDDYDVVIDALQKHRDTLWKMVQQNSNADMFNIMDQIRLEQIDQLDKAIQERRGKL